MKKTNQINEYLSGELTGSNLVNFENELKNNSELQQELTLYNGIDEAIVQKGVIELRNNLNRIHESLEKNVPVRKMFTNRYFLVAASVSILIVLSVFFFKMNNSSNTELYSMYFEPYESIDIIRGNSTDCDRLNNPYDFYADKQYEQAVVAFDKLLEKDASDVKVNFYKGISSMELSDYEDAIKSFQTILDSDASLFVELSEWYIGLCYLETNNDELAKKHFENVVGFDNNFSEKASEILRNL